MPPDEDQNKTAPGAAPKQQQPQVPTLGEPTGQFTSPISDIPVGPQEPTIPAPEPEPGPVFPPGPTMPGPTMTSPELGPFFPSESTVIGPESGPVFPSSPPPPPPPPPTFGPTSVVGMGSTPKSGGNTMKKLRMLLILVPIFFLIVIAIFVATSFLGKSKSEKDSNSTPTPATRSVGLPTLPPVSPGGFPKLPTPTPALSGGIYRDSTNGFTIESPTGWVQEKATALVTFKNPTEDLDAVGNKFNANLLVSMATLSTGQNFDSYIEQSRRELTIFSEYQKISDVKGNLAGQPAFQIDFTWKFGVHNVRQRIVGIQKDQNVFLLTATSQAATWDKYQPLFEKSISSFTFTGSSI